jgi:CBS domain-containing protein
VSEAAKVLSERKIGTVIVSNDGLHALGILSERDIVRELGRRGTGCLNETVGEMMTRDIITCQKADKAISVLGKMTKGRFRHMPVVEGGQMVGIVTLGDVVKYRLEEVEMEKTALEGMIMGY